MTDLAKTDSATVPTLGFLLRHPAHFIALGFGAGLAPFAPGTFGTLVAIPIAVLFTNHLSAFSFAAAIAVFTLIGSWAAQRAGTALGVPDHGAIVCDEVVAFVGVLYFAGSGVASIIVAFVVFRFFDIVKPPPIRQLDASLKNGFGVMLDDLLAAGYTLLVLTLIKRLVA